MAEVINGAALLLLNGMFFKPRSTTTKMSQNWWNVIKNPEYFLKTHAKLHFKTDYHASSTLKPVFTQLHFKNDYHAAAL